jgi:hypothetical protein
MEIVPAILGVLRVLVGFLMLVFIPGFALSLVIFPRSGSLRVIDRLVYSVVLSVSASIALVLFMEGVLKLDTTPENITLVIGVFSGLLLMVWLCERGYLNYRLKRSKKPDIPADNEMPPKLYSRETGTTQDQARQGIRTVVPSDNIVRPAGSPQPADAASGMETGGRVKVPDVLIRYKLQESPLPREVQSGIEPAGSKRAPEVPVSVEPEKSPAVHHWVLPEDIPKRPVIPTRPVVQPRVLPRDMPKRPVILTSAEPKEIPESPAVHPWVSPEDIPKHPVILASTELYEIPTRPNVQSRVLSKESLKREENEIVIESIRKLQKDILRDMDMFDILPDSLRKSGKNIENIRIPRKADVDKKLAEVKNELKDLDWLYE